ncbi:MAG: hypothetical protein IBX56_12320 [Methylomicrobium sp.]|nr:hypothetical protein [Methylomicrobium sp.]
MWRKIIFLKAYFFKVSMGEEQKSAPAADILAKHTPHPFSQIGNFWDQSFVV